MQFSFGPKARSPIAQPPTRRARSAPGSGITDGRSTAGADFSPAFGPIAGLWACKAGKNWPRWGRFSLSTHPVRQAPGGRQIYQAVAAFFLCVGLSLGTPQTASGQPQKPPPIFMRIPSQEEEAIVQILTGELELHQGKSEEALRALLAAARKTKNETLFQRSTEIALRSSEAPKSLEAGLLVTQAWQAAIPNSALASRYMADILLRLGRTAEAMEPLANLLKTSSVAERLDWINNTPRFLGASTHPAKQANLLQSILQPYADAPETGLAVNVALARLWLNANEPARALELAQKAHQIDPSATDPAVLAMEMMGLEPKASAIVESHLQQRPEHLGLRLVFARALSLAQRNVEAVAQLELITQQQPELPAPWITLGTLHLDLHNPKEAIIALQNYLEKLAKYGEQSPSSINLEGKSELILNPDAQESTPEQNRQKAWLLLAQASAQLGDHDAAQTWLSKVDDPRLARDVAQRQVNILAKQGKIAEARKIVRNLGEQQADDRTKVLLETMVLREARNWPEARKVLNAANQRIPNDIELLYEQAMVEEKLNKVVEMERLLRRVIDLKPDHFNALNALGYTWADRNMRLAEAKTLVKRALSLAPGDPFIMDSMAWVEYRLGNRKEALRLLRAAYKARPDTEIGAHLGELLWLTGQREEALRIWKESRKRDADNDVLKATLSRLKVKL